MVEIVKETPITSRKDFLKIAEKSLADSKLSPEEKDKINALIAQYNLEKTENKVKNKQEIGQIRNEYELKELLKTSQIYKDIMREASALTHDKIKDIQYMLGVNRDGNFWINTILAYKNSPLSDIFSIKELSEWKKVGKKDVKWFIHKFSKLNWVDSEILAIIISMNLWEESFVSLDGTGKITVYWKDWRITFSEKPSLEWLLHTSFIKKDLNIIRKQLSLISSQEDKENYILTLKEIIKQYKFQEQAREIFTKNTPTWIKINLPELSLNNYIDAGDLFWDYKILNIWDKEFINNWQWDFINEETWEKLFIFHWKILNIQGSKEEKEEKIEKTYESITEKEGLSQEFWNWLTKEWKKLLWTTGKNSCWPATAILINAFLRTKWIKNGFNISVHRNWANFDSLLEWWNVSVTNPFIVEGKKIISESSLLRGNWIDLSKIINEKLIVKSRVISFPKDAEPWEIIVFNQGATSKMISKTRRTNWHVEVKWSNNIYYSYYKSNRPWWSASSEKQEWDPEIYKKLTWFTWVAYSIERKKTT